MVHVVGRPGWFDPARWDSFHVRRERLAARARARLMFWLDADAIALASSGAPDLRACRGGLYAFRAAQPNDEVPPANAITRLAAQPIGPDSRGMAGRSRRIAEIRSFLAQHPTPPDDLLAAPLDELGRLLHELGEPDAALTHWREVELPFHRRRKDERAAAITMVQIADILQARGQLDEALRTRQEEQLPVYERLGDVRSKAIVECKIAFQTWDRSLAHRQEAQVQLWRALTSLRKKGLPEAKQLANAMEERGVPLPTG